MPLPEPGGHEACHLPASSLVPEETVSPPVSPLCFAYATSPALAVRHSELQSVSPPSHTSFPSLQTSRANKPGPWTQSVSVLGTQQGKEEHETSIDPLRNDVPSLSYQILFTLQL